MKTPDAFDGEQLLSGALDPDDAPKELKELAGLIRVARAPVQGTSPAVDQAFVASIANEVRRSAQLGPVASPTYLARIRRLPSGRVAVATTALMLTGGLAAAAATGSLPVPVQRAVSHGLSHLGISLPDPQSSNGARAAGNATSVATGSAKTKNTTGTIGLCKAYLYQSGTNGLRSTRNTATVSERARLGKIASGQNETVLAYCQGLVDQAGRGLPGASGVARTKGPSHSSTTSQGSIASGKVRHSSNSNQGANTSRSPKTPATPNAKQSNVTTNATGRSSAYKAASPIPSRHAKRVRTKRRTTKAPTSSTPVKSTPRSASTSLSTSIDRGKGVSTVQTTL
ncbi:MAG TPA: hypothetical protein VMU99_04720 [Acidimicrobiales bacterium]|nr:hypothetical protein [Acidimicrobiales bacterium]